MLEIERKFLVKNDAYKKSSSEKYRIIQGFLNTDPERTVRVRIKNDRGFLTVKGKSNASGTTRFEWEKEIPHEDAKALLKLCENTVIDKVRFIVNFKDYTFEIDEFKGENSGLILAEIELSAENENFPKPDWLGKEVTGEIKYYNSQLSSVPYKEWNN